MYDGVVPAPTGTPSEGGPHMPLAWEDEGDNSRNGSALPSMTVGGMLERKGASYRVTQSRPSHATADAAHFTGGGTHTIRPAKSRPDRNVGITTGQRRQAFSAGLSGI